MSKTSNRLRIKNEDHCPYCGHWSGEDESPWVLISKKRYQWLKLGAQMAIESEGADAWLDWMDDKDKLEKEEAGS